MTEIAMQSTPTERKARRPVFLLSLRARVVLVSLVAALAAAALGALAITLIAMNAMLPPWFGTWSNTAAALFIVLLPLACGVAFVVVQAFLMPVIRRLWRVAHVAEAVADGDLAQRTGFVAGDEIGTLGRSLDVMVGRLQERNRQLDTAVRTHDEELARLGAILASIGDGVVVLDRRGRVVMVNRAAIRLLGTEDAFWESEFSELVSHLDATKPLAPQLASQKRMKLDTEAGLVLDAEASVVTTLTGEELGVMVVIRDITRDALAMRLKDEFITQVSHELRTPLAAIKGASDVLTQTASAGGPGQRFLNIVNRNVVLLDGMICDLLDISEMLVGTFSVRMEPLMVQPLLWEALDAYKPHFHAAGLELQVVFLNANLRVQGDARRLGWAIRHLLDNALKYTPRGGTVTVALGAMIFGHAVIDVADTGAGISARDLPHIFEPYYRGEAVTAEGQRLDPRGLGLGLFIARTVTEAHGGSLTVTSEPGRGSTFSIVLPLAPR